MQVRAPQRRKIVNTGSPCPEHKTSVASTTEDTHACYIYANSDTAASTPATVARSEKPRVSGAALLPLDEPVEFDAEDEEPEVGAAPALPVPEPEPDTDAVPVATASVKRSVEAYVLQLLVAADVGV